MGLSDHPGALGPQRGSLFTIHHGNWPTYPSGDNWLEPLFQFTAFAPGTGFVEVDDIDRALLLVADVPCGQLAKPLDERNFHVAVWHSDLLELQRRGLIEGIVPTTESAWEKLQWEKVAGKGKKLLYKATDGTWHEIEPPLPDPKEDEENWKPFVTLPSGRMVVTKAGREAVRAAILEQQPDFGASLSPRIKALYELRYFDVCIREACVQLEHEIKVKLGSQAWGDRLTEAYIGLLRGRGGLLESQVRNYRQELRAVFKLIRNDFMHNLSDADEASALTILIRVARARSTLID